MSKQPVKRPGAVARILALAPEREIFVRAGGTVRFVRISTRLQIGVVVAALMAIIGWLAVISFALWDRGAIAVQQRALAEQKSAVSSVAAQARADKRTVQSVADDLEARQDALDALMRAHFGDAVQETGADTSVGQGGTGQGAADRNPVIGSASALTGAGRQAAADSDRPLSGAERLQQVRARQQQFADALQVAANARLHQVENAIRGFGLDPGRLARAAQGGPFEPAPDALAGMDGQQDLRALADLLDRLAAMEATLRTIPSGRPTTAPMETSSFGYRRDPFNGRPAFHAGIDFRGRHGQPILAASAGRVMSVGRQNGYGNSIDVDHGHGIVTRYAHLSGYTVRVGDRVQRGQQIGRMGSTGRSTGTHLHFEVRVNGAAVNPRRFLEAKRDVLEVQQTVRQSAVARSNAVRDRG